MAGRMADRAALEELVRLQGAHVRVLKEQKASAEQVRLDGRRGARTKLEEHRRWSGWRTGVLEDRHVDEGTRLAE